MLPQLRHLLGDFYALQSFRRWPYFWQFAQKSGSTFGRIRALVHSRGSQVNSMARWAASGASLTNSILFPFFPTTMLSYVDVGFLYEEGL